VRFILASASPRRRELLTAAGFEFDVEPAHVDETVHAGEQPTAYAQRIARDKALAVAARHPSRVVLAADTIVVVDREIFGKPVDRGDAARMLRALSNRDHAVLTAVAVARDGELREHVESTRVTFAILTPAEVDWYVASGEADDKAGGYAIQGLGARFIPRIEGSYSNVVGLPVAAVHRMLEKGPNSLIS
jgi:septum formation protein